MATDIIKRAGFKKVKSAGFFRASNEEKGGKLCRSRHVFDVTEETTVGQSILKGRCVRQANVNQEAYAVIIEVCANTFSSFYLLITEQTMTLTCSTSSDHHVSGSSSGTTGTIQGRVDTTFYSADEFAECSIRAANLKESLASQCATARKFELLDIQLEGDDKENGTQFAFVDIEAIDSLFGLLPFPECGSKIIDHVVLSNFCLGCATGPKEDEEGHAAWLVQHAPVCQKNVDCKAGQMEVEAALRLFRRSLEKHKLRYTTMLSDVDSRTFHALTEDEVYGYIKVEKKKDCINHVHKLMGAALRTLIEKKKAQGRYVAAPPYGIEVLWYVDRKIAGAYEGEAGSVDDFPPTKCALQTRDHFAGCHSEVNLAYENVKEVDGLDISKEGTEAWDAAVKRYEERIDRVEARITGRLRDQLGTAKNANEMFRIFSRFNALFVRPHIRGAIREYQTQLMQRVKDDIEALAREVQAHSLHCLAMVMQIDRQLSVYMKRVEDVLGKGWENHVEGQKLKSDADSFRAKLSTQPIFDDCVLPILLFALKGIGLVWESYKLDPYVQKLAETVFNFQEKVDDLITIEEQIDIDVRSLETCPYSASTFAEILNKIQKAVDDLSLHQYSNLHHWVSKLDEQVEAKLAGRLEAGIQAWTLALEGKKEGVTNETDPDATTPGDKEGGATVHHPLGGEPQVHTLVHEVRITNQVMYLSPSLEESRFSLLQQLFAWQNIVLSQIRIQSTRYQVQSKVTLKYDSWHKEVLGKFGTLLGNDMAQFHTTVSKSRSELEQQSIDTASTSDAVSFITYVQSLKRKMKSWEQQVELYKEGQRILERQRFQFPNWWLHVDNVEGEWSAFTEMMRRKDTAISSQVASLQMKVVAEDRAVEARTADFLADWEKSKPVQGSLKPSEATSQLAIFESKFSRLKEDRENLVKAKEALELQEPGVVSPGDERLHVALEELQDLKGVWSELAKIWDQIDQMKEQPWLSVQARKLRQQLDGLLNQLKELPARLRQYASYEYVKKVLMGYTKVNLLIVELKSDALKERHWKQLKRQLRVNWVLSELTLGLVWDIDLQRNEAIVKDVILVAQGEMALEEFLKQVREAWQNYELDLVNYQNKCRLIRGWDDLFNKVKEHINSVAAMKLSPYYKASLQRVYFPSVFDY
ncbi:hypothetical protein HPB51_013181 [Rhipicephalus microplus]|uniref:Uncharacterized protein n=1 Tax=Rhipicephalus microplus TaxID=6941 RepID=A0A9J6E1K5_RHIMP|nr:hypothetical protein HPB51_013181 [Rhipicephalus microplus]